MVYSSAVIRPVNKPPYSISAHLHDFFTYFSFDLHTAIRYQIQPKDLCPLQHGR
jgi:hypothetical protein